MVSTYSRGTEGLQNRTRTAAVLFALVLAGTTAFGQLPSATVLGVVRDATGGVVPGAVLTARNTDTGLSRTANSAADGSFRFSALPVGNYEFSAEHPGFQKEVRSGMTLAVSQEAVLNFSLRVGDVEQTVEVTAEAPVVNTTTSSLGTLVGEKTVADLPLNGRNFIDLALLQPGITQQKNNAPGSTSSNGSWYSSNGAPIRSNNYLLDGAIMTNLSSVTASSTSGTTLGIEGIREFRVLTNAFSADYGMTMGSQVLIVSKSGTNQLHGSLFEYLRNSALDARNFFDYQTIGSNQRLPPFKRNQFGAAAGGPIKKDKTFIYGVYEGLRQRLGVTRVDNVPAAGCHGAAGATITQAACPQLTTSSATIAPQVAPLLALFPIPNLPANQFTYFFTQPTTENYGQVRIDQTFSSNDSLFARYTIDDTQETDPLSYPQFSSLRNSRSQFATLSENRVFSSTLLNSARFSFSRTTPGTLSPSGIIGPQYSFVPGRELGFISINGITSLGPSTSGHPGLQKQNIFTWSDDVFYTRGRHSLKFGVLFNHYQTYSISSTNNMGTLAFANMTNFLLAQPQTVSALTPGSLWDRTYVYNTLGFYGQDDFRLFPNFTLNLGLRYEFQTPHSETHGKEANLRDYLHDSDSTLGPTYLNPSLRNFSPRFGFAWDVSGNGMTAIRGGFSVLFDVGNFGQALQNGINGTPPFASASSVSNPGTFTLPLSFPASAIGKSIRLVDYHMQQPHMLSYNLTAERQLPGKIAVTLAYAGSRGINIVQTVEGNPNNEQILPDGRLFWPATPVRKNPNWSSIEVKTGAANSWYSSLQFGLAKQLSHGLQFQSAYTWSRLIDQTQGQTPGDDNAGSVFGTAPGHLNVDRSLSDFDVTQSWRFNMIYQLPQMPGSAGIARAVLNGWRVGGILTLQSGQPFIQAVGSNISRSGVNNNGAGIDRPDLAPGRNGANIVSGTTAGCAGVKAGQQLGTPNLYFDPCAFTLQAPGFLGTSGRNILRGPGFANVDLSLAKNFGIKQLGESAGLEFRAEVFNILNRANFGEPNRTVFSGTGASAGTVLSNAGVITGTVNPSRQVQFALKLLF